MMSLDDVGALMLLAPLMGVLGFFAYLTIAATYDDYGKWGAVAATFAWGWVLTGVFLVMFFG